MKSVMLSCCAVLCFAIAFAVSAQDAVPSSAVTNTPLARVTSASPTQPWWNFHVANTDVGQLHPSFPAQYSGPNSLYSRFESAETISVDTFAGLRLWKGAEFHLDA